MIKKYFFIQKFYFFKTVFSVKQNILSCILKKKIVKNIFILRNVL